MLEVRLAHPSEPETAGALTASVYAVEGYLTRPDGSPDEHYRGELADGRRRERDAELVVAVDDGELVGTVTWCPPGSPMREVATTDRQGEVRMLAVARSARGRGVARALVTWCLDRADEQGLDEVVLCSLQEMTAAHALYTGFGFRRDPVLDWAPMPGVDLIGFRRDVHLQGAP
ncbi:GNAT family N-acetyltransferase [Solicola sp. PLA-1-18]|uniref:GNAT family N-acetyltransferase n=1 Tax=Solicola sp. PLA-1-18 TaxID=3380532 RepID=UPI003B824D18